MPRRRSTTVVAAALSICFVGALAYFGMQPGQLDSSLVEPLNPGGNGVSGWLSAIWTPTAIAANLWAVALFVPVGALAFLTLPRWAWPMTLLIGPALSVMLELVEWAAVPGRMADPLHMLFNSIGASIGIGIAALCTWLTARPRRTPVPAQLPFPPLPRELERTH